MNKYVIVRGDRSGVFAGELVSRNGQEIELKNCRRLYYWEGAATLSQLAMEGVKKPNICKFTMVVDNINILDAIEIIPCTEKAEQCIKDVSIWKI